MRNILAWLKRRLYCTVHGHEMEPARVYLPEAKSMTPGFRCDRCGREQSMLFRWQPSGGGSDE